MDSFNLRSCILMQWLCSYLLPLPQILMSNVFICLAFLPDQFFALYSVIFLLALPIFLHLLVYILGKLMVKHHANNPQIHPVDHANDIELNHSSLMSYVFTMGLLFDIIGYGPRCLLGVVDYRLKKSVAIYAGLEILPSLCLMICIGLLFKMNKEIRKKILSIFRC